MWKGVTIRSSNVSVNNYSAILSLFAEFAGWTMLPKYEAPRLSNTLFELFSVTSVSGMPVIFFLCVFQQ